MLRRSIFIFALLLLSGFAAVNARPYTWTAWLRYGQHMTLVNSAGESLREVELPLPDGYEWTENTVTASPSGRLAAYLVRKGGNAAQVVVYDTENAVTRAQYPIEADGAIWGTSWFAADEQNFNETETVVAFGYTIVDETTLNSDWRLIALDLTSGTPLYQLDGDDVIRRGLIADYLWTPIVRRYQGTEITFTLDILENEGNPTTFVWNTATGVIRPSVTFPNLKSDLFLPTDEVVSPMYGAAPIPIPEQGNTTFTLEVYDPILGGRYPFYRFKDSLPERVSFVQNGEYLLMQSYTSWTLLGRDGTVVDEQPLLPDMPIVSLQPIPDGFLYTTRLSLPDQANMLPLPVLLAVDTRDGRLDAGQSIWHLSLDEYWARTGGQDAPLQIVWVQTDAPVSSFVPWAQLAEPIYESIPPAPQSSPQPTLIPTPEPLFYVGMTVHVQTTGGEILNLRRDHTREAEVILYLEDDMALTLLEGPVQAEGFTWWRIRTEEGVEGWTVENNHDLQTLIPG